MPPKPALGLGTCWLIKSGVTPFVPKQLLEVMGEFVAIAGGSGRFSFPHQEPNPVFLVQFQIRALESQKRQQEIVLRRKTQEVRGGDISGGVPAKLWLSDTASLSAFWGAEGVGDRLGVGDPHLTPSAPLLGRCRRCAASPSPCRTGWRAGRARSRPCWTRALRSRPAPPPPSPNPAPAPSPASCASGIGKSTISWETPRLLPTGLGHPGQGRGCADGWGGVPGAPGAGFRLVAEAWRVFLVCLAGGKPPT